MADYKDIFNDTLGKLAGKVKEAADTSGVLDVYAQGANRAKAFGQLTKLTLKLNGEHEELQRIYTEIGRLYFEQQQGSAGGFFAPLFAQAGETAENIRSIETEIEALKEKIAEESGERDIEVEIGAFDDIVSADEKAAKGEE